MAFYHQLIRKHFKKWQLRAAQKRIEVEEENKAKARESRKVAADSLRSYENKILLKQNSVSSSGELGPLKYVANLTGVPMDKVVNWFILLFIFVFDPMAVTLVIATNRVFEKEGLKRNKTKEEEVTENAVITKKPGKKLPGIFKNPFKSKKKPLVEKALEKLEEVHEVVDNIEIPDVTPTQAPTQAPTVKTAPTSPGVVVKKKEPQKGIKPEDVATVRQNAKNLTRKIPTKRGY
jgi:hypothetical protein